MWKYRRFESWLEPDKYNRRISIASSQHVPFLLQKFPEALEAYEEAIELDSTNMSFVSNRAAVYLEQRKFEECIAEVSVDIYFFLSSSMLRESSP